MKIHLTTVCSGKSAKFGCFVRKNDGFCGNLAPFLVMDDAGQRHPSMFHEMQTKCFLVSLFSGFAQIRDPCELSIQTTESSRMVHLG